MSAKKYKYEQLLVQTDDELEQLEKNEYSFQDNLFSSHEGVQRTKEVSTCKMILNMLSYMEGVGFLAIPYAIREGGITAVIALCLLPFILGYTANLLSQCVDERDEIGHIAKRRCTYQEIAKDSWALYSVVPENFPQVPISAPQWAFLGTLVAFPTVFLKTFSHIAWLSVLSLISLIAVIGLMLSYEIPILFHSDFKLLLFWDSRGVFVALSILVGSYSIHTIAVSLAVDVRDQESKFKLALIFSYFFGAIFKSVFALSGFLAFRTNTKEVILNNVPPGIIAEIISILFTLNDLLTYAIPFLHGCYEEHRAYL